MSALLALTSNVSWAFGIQDEALREEESKEENDDDLSDESGGEESGGGDVGDDAAQDPAKNPRVRLLQTVPFCGREANDWLYSKIFGPLEVDLLLRDLDREEIPLSYVFQVISAVAEIGSQDALAQMFHSSEKWAAAFAAKIVEAESPPDHPEGSGKPDQGVSPDSKQTITKKIAGDMRRAVISAWVARGDISYDMLANGLIDEDIRVQFAAAKAVLEGSNDELMDDAIALCEEDERINKALGSCGSRLTVP